MSCDLVALSFACWPLRTIHLRHSFFIRTKTDEFMKSLIRVTGRSGVDRIVTDILREHLRLLRCRRTSSRFGRTQSVRVSPHLSSQAESYFVSTSRTDRKWRIVSWRTTVKKSGRRLTPGAKATRGARKSKRP